MKVGFIGLGNAGGKLAGSLLRNGFDLTVRDLDLLDQELELWGQSDFLKLDLLNEVKTKANGKSLLQKVKKLDQNVE